ncbi:MAG: KdsC family phosphatase [Myxococcota bacterium]
MSLPPDARACADTIRLVILDVDGVMTDGTLWYGEHGEVLKPFHVRDGFGIKLLRRAGIDVAVISGRCCPPLRRRLDELPIDHVFLERDDKDTALSELLARTGVPTSSVAHVGDDVLDLPVMRRVGLGITVQDAHPAVRRFASWTTHAPGGRGAVREVADDLLEARGVLEETCDALIAEKHGRAEPSP